MQVDLTFPFVPVVLGALVSSLVISLFLRWLVREKPEDERSLTAVAVVLLAMGMFCAVFGWVYLFLTSRQVIIVASSLTFAACALIGVIVWSRFLGQSKHS